MKRTSFIFVMFMFCAIAMAQPASTSKLGGAPGAPLRMGFGARGMGMGNALTAVRGGELNGYYNPALVPFQSTRTATASFGILSLDRQMNILSYGQDLKPTAGVFIGILNSGVSDIDGRDINGRPTEVYSTSENALIASFGTRVSNFVSIGLSAKILYYHLFEGLNSTTVGLDIGFVYSFSDQLALGGVLQDINAKYTWDTSKLYGRDGNTTTERFPLRRRLGVSYMPEYYGSTVSAELEIIGSTSIMRLGAEMYPIEQFALRAGVDQIDFEGNLVAKPSFGFTLKPDFGFVSSYIHYAYVLEPYSPHNIHIIALSVTFD